MNGSSWLQVAEARIRRARQRVAALKAEARRHDRVPEDLAYEIAVTEQIADADPETLARSMRETRYEEGEYSSVRDRGRTRRRRAMSSRRDRDPRDNSFGLGYFEPPAKIRGLGRFVDNLRPNSLVDLKVYPREGIWMLTARADERFSILEGDLASLMRLGLVRVQVNRPGTISLYFKDTPIAGPAHDRRRRARTRVRRPAR